MVNTISLGTHIYIFLMVVNEDEPTLNYIHCTMTELNNKIGISKKLST
jgi:hypothetical protein